MVVHMLPKHVAPVRFWYPAHMHITVAPTLPVKIAWLTLTVPSQLSVTDQLAETAKTVGQQFQQQVLSEDVIVQQVRTVFRATGIDPTKYRPSSESLIRRAVKGEPVRSIHPIVDINNICSMEYRLPLGCYDVSQLQGDVMIRLGRPDEAYTGVAKQISIGGKLCCADTAGAFGSPISDSARTKVTEQTKEVLVVAFGHTSTSDDHLRAAMERFQQLVGSNSPISISSGA